LGGLDSGLVRIERKDFMSKTQSGLILIGIAIVINVVSNLLAATTRNNQNASIAGFVALLMFCSVVVGLFGLFRLISGLLSKQ
jgi:hypothetical protein